MPFKKSASDALAAIGLKMKAKLDKIIIMRLMAFGAFVEFAPGREGLVHISELEIGRAHV